MYPLRIKGIYAKYNEHIKVIYNVSLEKIVLNIFSRSTLYIAESIYLPLSNQDSSYEQTYED